MHGPRDKIAELCQCYSIQKWAFFGSGLRDDFNPASDVDVLVEFGPGAGVGFFMLCDLEQELSRILGGRKVAINTPGIASQKKVA